VRGAAATHESPRNKENPGNNRGFPQRERRGYRLVAGAVVEEAPPDAPEEPEEPAAPEPVVDGALEPLVEVEVPLDDPVVVRVLVPTPTRAFTPLSRLMTRLRLAPSSAIKAPRRRRSTIVALRDGAVA